MSAAVSVGKRLNNNDVLALLFYSVGCEGRVTTIRKVSEELANARLNGMPTGTIAIRPDPKGYYSESIAEHSSKLLSGGLLSQKSPLRITEKGKNLLTQDVKEIIDEKGEEAKQLLNFLHAPTP